MRPNLEKEQFDSKEEKHTEQRFITLTDSSINLWNSYFWEFARIMGVCIKSVHFHRWHDLVCRKSWGICKKLSDLINEFCKVARYKISTQKSTVFLCTCNEQLKWNQVNNSIYSSINNHKILWKKFEKSTKPTLWKL